MTVEPVSGNVRMGLAVFQPGAAYYNRNEALVQSMAPTGGREAAVCYQPPVSGSYGLTVWNEGGTTDTTFYIKGTQKMYLPLLIKN